MVTASGLKIRVDTVKERHSDVASGMGDRQKNGYFSFILLHPFQGLCDVLEFFTLNDTKTVTPGSLGSLDRLFDPEDPGTYPSLGLEDVYQLE